jgi:hypothetical protein
MQLLIHPGHNYSIGGYIEAPHVLVRPEQIYPAIGPAIGFQSLEYLLSVVQHGCRGVQGEIVEGLYGGIVPTGIDIILLRKHMIGKSVAKAQFPRAYAALVGGQQFNIYRHAFTKFINIRIFMAFGSFVYPTSWHNPHSGAGVCAPTGIIL